MTFTDLRTGVMRNEGVIIESGATPTIAAEGAPLYPRSTPFTHFLRLDAADADAASATLDWLEESDPWIVRVGPNHHFYELMLREVPPPRTASLLFRESWEEVRAECSRAFGIEFHSPTLAIHKMQPGCHVPVHTDYGTNDVSHRFIIHLNRGWEESNGGFLFLLDAEHRHEFHEDHRYYLPQHRLGVGFEVSARSYHSVSEVLAGTRYTLCYSLTPCGAVSVK
jgi:hypothetical protein